MEVAIPKPASRTSSRLYCGTLLLRLFDRERKNINKPSEGTIFRNEAYVSIRTISKCRLHQSNERLPLWARVQLVICPADSLSNLTCANDDIAGKSSLTVQFVDGHFVESYYPTIENTFTKVIKYKGQEFATDIIDTAGQVRQHLVFT